MDVEMEAQVALFSLGAGRLSHPQTEPWLGL